MFNVFFFNLESTIFTIIANNKEASQMSRSRYNTNQVMMNSKISLKTRYLKKTTCLITTFQ